MKQQSFQLWEGGNTKPSGELNTAKALLPDLRQRPHTSPRHRSVVQQNSVLSIRVHNTYPSFSGKSCLEKGEKIVFRNPEKSGKNHKKHGQKSRA